MKDKIQIVKIGGNLINDASKLKAFLKDFATIKTPKILVHGGGKAATTLSDQLQIPTEMVEGRRITSAENLDVVTMVYAGLINKKIIAHLQSTGCNAIGLSGADANCILASKRPSAPIDYGYVGDIAKVNTEAIEALLSQGLSPVFSAICHDGNGQLLNTNADTIAAEVAIAMSQNYEAELLYCFEKKGVLKDVLDEDSVIEKINTSSYEELQADGLINEGMLPKLKNCFHALNHNVQQVKIGNEQLLSHDKIIHTTLSL